MEASSAPAKSSPAAEAIDPLTDRRWPALLERSGDALAFHHPAWLGLLREQYGYEIGAWAVTAPDGALAAGLPFARVTSRLTGTRVVGLPFSDLCPPVVADGADGHALADLAATIAASARAGGVPVEARTTIPGLPGASAPLFHRHVLPLAADPAEVAERFARAQVRRGIAKARRSGVTVVRRRDRAALDAFYALHLRHRRALGVPTQPKSFIRRFEGLFAAGLGFVSLALWQRRTIAAAVFLSHGGTLIYKYGASDPAHLDKRPNNALFMDAIEWGCANGQRRLDLGRTDFDNPGLRAFKRSWGAEEERLAYTYLPPRAPRGAGSQRGWTAAAIRTLPPAFGGLVGTALYGHFG